VLPETDVAGKLGVRTEYTTLTDVDIVPNQRSGMNKRCEPCPSLFKERTIFPLGLRLTNRTDKKIVWSVIIVINAAQDGGIVSESAKYVRPVVEKAFDPPRSSGADRLLRPRINFAAELAGADDDQVLIGHFKSCKNEERN
jgi:hypothetical protein